MALNATTNAEVNAAILKLRKISDNAKKQSQSVFKEAAGPLIAAIQGRAPQSDRTHYRYSTAKATNKIKTPPGEGNLVAAYVPGNLRRSFRTFTFRRSAAVFVGPKVQKGEGRGRFEGNKVDGYYAHFVEFGTEEMPATPFVRPAVDAAGAQTMRFAAELLKREILKAAK